MTINELFALPVGTRCYVPDIPGMFVTKLKTPDDRSVVNLAISVPAREAGDIATDLVVIPGELDASEVVE